MVMPCTKGWTRVKAVAERLEGNKVSLSVEVDAERVDAAIGRAYRKVAKQVKIPGFRQGKVPRRVIEARFGKEALYQEALDELIPIAYEEAVQSTQIEPIDQPTVTDYEIEEGKPLKFTATVEVTPEVELGEYKGIKVEKLVEQVEAKDIDHMLEHFQEDHAELVSPDRNTVEQGDFVTIDFEGTIDGVPFPGGAAKGYPLEIGSGRFVPGFEEQLVGAEIDQEVEVRITFPEEYEESLAGKDALFKVTVRSIKVKQLPELNDEFAAAVSDAKSLLDLRAKIRADMEEAANRRAEQKVRNDLIDKLIELSKVDVPDVLIERELERRMSDLKIDLAYHGLTLGAYLERTEQTEEELNAELRSAAEHAVKGRLALRAVAKREGIVVEGEEVEAKISELVAQSRNPESMREMMSDPDRRESFQSSLLLERTIDFLLAHADVEEKAIPSAGHGHHHE